MKKSRYIIFKTCLGIFFLIRYGLLIFLAYWRDQEIAQNNVIMFGIGVLLLVSAVIFNRRSIDNAK
ncbi:Uncharacterised protein [Streptococcus pneumoniae]|nr:hypothetical protein KQ3_06028 [Bacillus cereus B5-2]COF39044.1 Uncharacterised protein [Streptococcus pneumoniae]COF65992.1 Uncharacterised protein [Streptococcus pneumoniae]COQ33911.1 Uncharacterised protein [Streptococcus pneumoniae]COR56522.1 Uncharacterised protein [Streptococcus pneumoniae]